MITTSNFDISQFVINITELFKQLNYDQIKKQKDRYTHTVHTCVSCDFLRPKFFT